MTTAMSSHDNPFADPTASFEENARGNSFAVDATLAVGKNASLTLGTDSLIVLGESLQALWNCRLCN
jgi:sphingosine kinase